jgi:predicted GIY-YIG superfamily endonuclease
MVERRYSVYIMASRRNGTLYVGVTNHLAARAFNIETEPARNSRPVMLSRCLFGTSTTATSTRRLRGKSS